MRISDWSSDVCSSDLFGVDGRFGVRTAKIENETVRDLFGGEAVFTGRIGMTPEGAITLTQLSGRAPDFRLSGGGRYEPGGTVRLDVRSEEHTSELQSLMRISYAVFCLKKKTRPSSDNTDYHPHSET